METECKHKELNRTSQTPREPSENPSACTMEEKTREEWNKYHPCMLPKDESNHLGGKFSGRDCRDLLNSLTSAIINADKAAECWIAGGMFKINK